MTVRELATQLKLEVCCGAAGLDKKRSKAAIPPIY